MKIDTICDNFNAKTLKKALMKKKRFDIVGMGLNAVDFLCVVPSYPRFNTKVKMLEFHKQGGGQIATAMVALSRWGLSTSYIGKVGDDELGRFTAEELKKEKVDIRNLVIAKGAASQFAFIIIDKKSGERTIVWNREDRTLLKPSDIKKENITAGNILHLDGHEIDAALKAAKWAKKEGMTIVLDAESTKKGTEKLIQLTDVLITSEDFPCQFLGIKNQKKALKEMRGMGPEIAVITKGGKGAALLSKDCYLNLPAYPVKTKDTTGAGDIFHAGFIYGLTKKWEPGKILAFANAAASLKCTKIGGRKGIATPQEIEYFVKKRNAAQNNKILSEKREKR